MRPIALPLLRGPRAGAALLLVGLATPGETQLTTLGAQYIDETGSATGVSSSGDRFGSTVVRGDFNHDGFADLAVGVPGQSVGGQSGAGAVHVYYGSPGGLRLDNDQIFHQNSAGILNTAEAGDGFGAALAVYDRNCDGIDDLVIGVPFEDLDGHADAGMIHILYGRNGLPLSGSLSASRENPCPQANDRYGFSLAGGHTSTKHYLAVGAPGRTVDLVVPGAGAFDLYSTGLPGCVVLVNISCFPYHQNTFILGNGDIADSAEINDGFAYSLVTGDFNGDGEDDLAVGVPFENLAGGADGGAVHVLYFDPALGNYGDFRLDNDDFWHQDSFGILGAVEPGDRFGGALAAGDFNADGRSDLAIGIAGERVNGIDEAGAVAVLYGGNSGLSFALNQLFHQDVTGILDSCEANDHFGSQIAAGDIDGDGYDDLAIGVPDEDIGGASNAGLIHLLYGAASIGLSGSGSQRFHQDAPTSVPDISETGDFFGSALAIGDFDGSGFGDLAIGVSGEDVLVGQTDEGQVTLLYGLDPATGTFGALHYTASQVTVPESTGTVTVTVQRTGGARLVATVGYDNAGGTATEGLDFLLPFGTLNWPAGDLSNRSFLVTILDDTLHEPAPAETILIPLSNASTGTAIGTPGSFTVRINDNDPVGQIFVDGFESGNTGAWSQP